MHRAFRSKNFASILHGVVLSVAFALVAATVSNIEAWIPALEVKVGEPAPVTVRLPSTYFRLTLYRDTVHYLATGTSTCPNMLERNEVLRKGSECGGLVAAFEAQRRAYSPLYLMGMFALYTMVGLVLTGFMRYKTMGRARLLRTQTTVFSLMALTMIAAKGLLLFTSLPAFIVPTLFLPLLSGYYLRRGIALLIVVVTSLFTVSLVNFDMTAFLVFSMSGVTAVLSSGGPVRRGRTLLKAGAIAGWTALLMVVVTTMVFARTFKIHDDPAEHLDPNYSIWIASLIGGFASGVLAYVLAPLVGWLVGEVSRNRLIDLQDLNNPILKRIQERAPGTWEHARAMANLAEASVNAIGGNPALVRAGAYYHDAGKSNHPEYFIENQGGGPNPHDDLTPDESASRIFRHVVDGVKMLRQEGIPEDVVEFCYSHHGTSLLEYFWHKVTEEGNPEGFTERDFTYPGYKPTTRETGILMLVDAIEAGARTVDQPDREAFSALVRSIVFSKLSQGQLDETGLGLGDMRVVVNTLVDSLVNMYHGRIKYPWQTGDTDSRIKTTSSAPPREPETSSDEADMEGESREDEGGEGSTASVNPMAVTLIRTVDTAAPGKASAAVPAEEDAEPPTMAIPRKPVSSNIRDSAFAERTTLTPKGKPPYDDSSEDPEITVDPAESVGKSKR